MRNALNELTEALKCNEKTAETIAYCRIEIGNVTLEMEAPITIAQFHSLNKEYDSGYGGQELYGTIVFNDSSWLERGEYDGSEWWEYKCTPKRGEVMNKYQNTDAAARYEKLLSHPNDSCKEIYQELLDEELLKPVHQGDL